MGKPTRQRIITSAKRELLQAVRSSLSDNSAAAIVITLLLTHETREHILGTHSLSTMERASHSSALVAPLQIVKDLTRVSASASDKSNATSRTNNGGYLPRENGQITPPLTPHDYELKFERHTDFQPFLRAFYPYHPTFDETSSTVTLPLNTGDIILVHSVHTNGWADGTLLISGARGWLPTNYCEGYDSEPIRSLMKSLIVFWDLVRGSSIEGLDVFRESGYVRGLVAGVRCLLVCLGISHSCSVVLTKAVGKDRLSQQRV